MNFEVKLDHTRIHNRWLCFLHFILLNNSYVESCLIWLSRTTLFHARPQTTSHNCAYTVNGDSMSLIAARTGSVNRPLLKKKNRIFSNCHLRRVSWQPDSSHYIFFLCTFICFNGTIEFKVRSGACTGICNLIYSGKRAFIFHGLVDW